MSAGSIPAVDLSVLNPALLPRPSGTVVRRSAIVTQAQALNYCRAAFHAIIDMYRRAAQTTPVDGMANAAAGYVNAHRVFMNTRETDPYWPTALKTLANADDFAARALADVPVTSSVTKIVVPSATPPDAPTPVPGQAQPIRGIPLVITSKPPSSGGWSTAKKVGAGVVGALAVLLLGSGGSKKKR